MYAYKITLIIHTFVKENKRESRYFISVLNNFGKKKKLFFYFCNEVIVTKFLRPIKNLLILEHLKWKKFKNLFNSYRTVLAI